MTADFGNFDDKADEKQKTKDEMNPAEVTINTSFW